MSPTYKNDKPSRLSVHIIKNIRTLNFDLVRSPQQIERWNRLTTSVLNQQASSRSIKPSFILKDTARPRPPVVFKQIQHLPEKTTNEFLVNLLKIKECFPDHPKQMLRRSKNWLRRV
ncbi:hypothetical protein RhiirA5_408212 [Rhizophagus irregularis]|uniref:Uncharacterized protein n=1 Tax=Rhizophagus irregularis TaxID=588596 RepID=A0A2N0S6A7_9GLOM|nr:hypothetical protein RhiirA5_408212 [Rhizophagus irregularis]PKC71081.1 hypothetical protein RhiirA1_453945 [Rhizophagus irregularis]